MGVGIRAPVANSAAGINQARGVHIYHEPHKSSSYFLLRKLKRGPVELERNVESLV